MRVVFTIKGLQCVLGEGLEDLKDLITFGAAVFVSRHSAFEGIARPRVAAMAKSVRKAVIPAAGFGTRFLPFSKAVPKEMLPLVDRPVIEYVISEAVDAGIEDILIITSRHKKVLEDHFDRHPELETALLAKGKEAEAAAVKGIAEMANVHFIRQGEALGLGHAIGKAKAFAGDEPFVVLNGDDIMHPDAGVLKHMIQAYETYGSSVVGLMNVPHADISKYGCAEVEPIEGDVVKVTRLVEKPPIDEAPSDLAVMGRYLFTPTIFREIDRTLPGVGGEIQITDAMVQLMNDEPMLGVTFEKGRYDTGMKEDYLRAMIDFTLERDDLGPYLRSLIAEVAKREGLT